MMTTYEAIQLILTSGLLIVTFMGVNVAFVAAVIAASKKK